MSKKNKQEKKNATGPFLWMSIDAYRTIEEEWSSAYTGVSPSLEAAKETALDSLAVEDEFVVVDLFNAPVVKYEINYVATPVADDD